MNYFYWLSKQIGQKIILKMTNKDGKASKNFSSEAERGWKKHLCFESTDDILELAYKNKDENCKPGKMFFFLKPESLTYTLAGQTFF